MFGMGCFISKINPNSNMTSKSKLQIFKQRSLRNFKQSVASFFFWSQPQVIFACYKALKHIKCRTDLDQLTLVCCQVIAQIFTQLGLGKCFNDKADSMKYCLTFKMVNSELNIIIPLLFRRMCPNSKQTCYTLRIWKQSQKNYLRNDLITTKLLQTSISSISL